MSNESGGGEQRQKSCPSTDGMLELDSLNIDGAITAQAQDVSAQNSPLSLADSTHNDNDTDSSSEDDGGEGISASYHPSSPLLLNTNQQTTYFLGQTFNTQTDQIQMNTYAKSLYWLTYRNDLVVALRPYSATNAQSLVGNITHGGGLSGVTGEGGMKTDAGWGCMLRSAQMLLAECVRRHYNTLEVKNKKKKKKKKRNNEQSCSSKGGRGNRRHDSSSSSSSSIEHHKLNWKQLDDPYEVERIANWFADFPNHADYDALSTMGKDDYDINGSNVKEEEETKYAKQRIVKSAEHRLDGDNDIGKGGLAYHWYSLHQMVAAGLGLGILPGEWYGPTTACHVLRELNEIHVDRRMRLLARQRKNKKNLHDEDETSNKDDDDVKCDVFRVHVATEGCVYLDAIAKLMNQSRGGCDDTSTSTNDKIDEHHPLSLPTDNDDQIIDDPLRLPTQDQNSPECNKSLENMDNTTWDTSLLLLLPLRLGIQSISTSNYGSTLARLISFPQSVGMLGGTPRHALWFYGADAVDPPPPLSDDMKDGSDKKNSSSEAGGWYGLDPHTVQLAPRGTRVLVEDSSDDTVTDTTRTPKYQWQIQLTDSYLRSLHISSTTSHHNHDKSIPLSNLDPSCALGFYIHDYTDFVRFQSLLNKLSTDHCKPNKLPEIITILEKTPNYEVDVSSAMHDMIGGKGKERTMDGVSMVDDIDEFSMQSEEGNNGAGCDDEDDNDDDDFVLI